MPCVIAVLITVGFSVHVFFFFRLEIPSAQLKTRPKTKMVMKWVLLMAVCKVLGAPSGNKGSAQNNSPIG